SLNGQRQFLLQLRDRRAAGGTNKNGVHLTSSFAGQNRRDGLQQKGCIGPEGLVLDVIDIEFDLAGKVNFAATADLPDTRDAGQRRESAIIRQRVTLHFPRQRRARSDQRHVADQHIVKLRQFVQGELPQPAAYFRDARIVLDFERDALGMLVPRDERGQARLGIETHRADFVHLEFPAEAANPGLGKKDRTAILKFHQQADEQQQGTDQEQHEQAGRKVNASLQYSSAVQPAAPVEAMPGQLQLQEIMTRATPCPGIVAHQRGSNVRLRERPGRNAFHRLFADSWTRNRSWRVIEIRTVSPRIFKFHKWHFNRRMRSWLSQWG